MQSVTIFWDTENEDDEDVVRMLKTLPHWDWSAPTYFRVSPTAIYNKVYIFFELVSYLVGIFLNFVQRKIMIFVDFDICFISFNYLKLKGLILV